jgi:hypothetical protein
VSRSYFLGLRLFTGTLFRSVRATGAESAATGWIHGTRGLTFEDLRVHWRVGIGFQRRTEEKLRVGMSRRFVECVRGSDLADLAEVHHRHPVADVLHDRQVVGDE